MRSFFSCTKAGIIIFSVLLYRLMFPAFDLPELAYVFALPLLVWSPFAERKVFYRVTFLYSFLAWVSTIFWLRHVTWVGVIALSLILGLLMWVWWVCAYLIFNKVGRSSFRMKVVSCLGLSGLWVVIEWVRSFLFTGFPWLTLAASQWTRPTALQLAEYTGSSGVSFLLILFNLLMAFGVLDLTKAKRDLSLCLFKVPAMFYCAFSLLVLNIFLYSYAVASSGREVSLFRAAWIQPYVPATLKWEEKEASKHMDVLEILTEFEAAKGADVVLWPESCTPYPVYGYFPMEAWVEDLSELIETPILMGNVAMDPEGWYNGVFYVSELKGLSVDFYGKSKRVPFGEYIPLRNFLPSWVGKVVPIEGDIKSYEFSKLLPVHIKNKDYKVASLVCYEDIFPEICRSQVNLGADFIYVVTNDAWYGEESGAAQHAAHSVLRAVESRRPVLRCGNHGWSGWIDELGRIRFNLKDESGSIFIRSTESQDVTRHSGFIGQKTAYVASGNWFVYLSIGLALYLAVIYFRSSRIN